MFQTVFITSVFSLYFCWVAEAQPQTVSYYSGTCLDNVPCDIVSSLPSEGFVLTDLVSGNYNGLALSIQEVIGANVSAMVEFRTGVVSGSNNHPSYHLNSGIPFAGGAGIRVVTTDNQLGVPLKVTLVGYIPNTGCCTAGVPAVGSLGLGVMVLGVVGLGAALLRRARANN